MVEQAVMVELLTLQDQRAVEQAVVVVRAATYKLYVITCSVTY
jgi:hypothetical protein